MFDTKMETYNVLTSAELRF